MIIDEIDIEGVAVLEAEDQTPVAAHAHRPEATQLPCQRVQDEPRQVHVLDLRGPLQPGQDAPDALHLLRTDLARVAPFDEALETSMPYRLYHSCLGIEYTHFSLELQVMSCRFEQPGPEATALRLSMIFQKSGRSFGLLPPFIPIRLKLFDPFFKKADFSVFCFDLHL